MVNTFNTDGKIILSLFTKNGTAIVDGSTEVEYTTNQIKITQKNASGLVSFVDKYTYTSDGKNYIKRERLNSAGVLTSTDNYSGFDDKKTYNSLFPVGYSALQANANNYTTDVYTTAAGATTTYTYTFEYNADGYITKRISASGAVNTYEYIKK